ncbi:fimbrial biogenesis chaperone [Vibrio algicola]|nr:fimbria/pilus periplasmic chaperone [Vibrio algicola]
MKQILMLIVCILVSSNSYAFRVEPFLQAMEPLGKKASATFKVINDSDKPLPIETEILRAHVNEQGKEVTQPDDSFFLIPPQTMIPPQSSQVFRLKYIGEPILSQTEAYRLVFKQLSLDENQGKSGVQLLFHFNVLLLVSPKDAKSNLITNIADHKDKKSIDVKLKNEGNKYVDLSKLNMNVVGSEGENTLKWFQYSPITGFQILLPQRERQFVIESGDIPNVGTVKTVDFSE